MKNTAITRDVSKQAQYKERLKEESKKIYGRVECYASHKPYKGLIASHIKPYKICVLEQDSTAEFDLNNGLLLTKVIDDYFDKLLLTFDSNGKIVFGENIPQEIKDEFAAYYLDEKVYNKKRKEYMAIHRSLFYYRNYCQAQMVQAEDRLKRIQIPYFDCGIKLYKGEILVSQNGSWIVCPLSRLKAEFINRTKESYKMDFFISNADLLNKLAQEKQYLLNTIPEGFNCPHSMIDLQNNGAVEEENAFKVSQCNYEIQNGEPEKFLKLLGNCFRGHEESIQQFRRIIGLSLLGRGFSKSVVFSGQSDSINMIVDILTIILGTYVFIYEDTKKLSKKAKINETIPNCRILIIKINNEVISESTINNIVSNRFFQDSVVNIDKYTPFYVYAGKKKPLFDAIGIKFETVMEDFSVKEIMENESGKILKWLLEASIEISSKDDLSIQKIFEGESIQSNNTCLREWMKNNCYSTSDLLIRTSASLLYQDYINYAKTNDFTPLPERKFYMELSRNYEKKRMSSGMFYCGVSLK